MIINELLLLIHIILLSLASLGALALGKEALVAFVCLQSVLANLFVTKQMTLFGLNATAADAFTIGSVIGLNLLQEYFGKESAQKAIWINLGTSLVYIAATQIHLAYVPNNWDTMHVHCYALLSVMPRIVITSVIVFFVVQQLDYLLYGLLKRKFADRFLVLRNCISLSICQLLDTVLFTVIALYGIANNLTEIIIVSYTIKLIAIALTTPWLALTRFIVKFKSRNV